MTRQPTYFIPHGGGPWPFMDAHWGGGYEDLTAFLKSIRPSLPQTPKAILLVTAHWDDVDTLTVSTAEHPGMYYDYYGFPPHTYEIKYPAPGSPEVANDVVAAMQAAGIPVKTDDTRGYDHGTFIPLMVAFPEADIPVVQMSLRGDLDPEFHIKFGEALAPLREQGILILASGMSYHNMRAFRTEHPAHEAASMRFDDWLKDTLENADTQTRDTALTHWWDNPDAQACHFPTPEHFLPVMVAAGAGGKSAAKQVFKGRILDKTYSAYRWE